MTWRKRSPRPRPQTNHLSSSIFLGNGCRALRTTDSASSGSTPCFSICSIFQSFHRNSIIYLCKKIAFRSTRHSFLLFQLLQRAWPIVLEQPAQRTVGEQLAAGLAAWAVVRLVLGIDDPLNR